MLPKPALLRVLAVSMYFIGTIPDNGTTQPALYSDPFNAWGGAGSNNFVPVLGGTARK